MLPPRLLLLLPALVLALGGLARAAPPLPPPGGERPNFVVIVLDDWGWMESGAYGNPVIRTPNIDRLAREGAQFHNAFLTASTCSSSRASILTGLHPVAAGVPRLHVPLPADRILVSTYLRQSGYFTASVGKWHLGETAKRQFDLVVEERVLPEDRQSGMEDWLPILEKRLPRDKPFFLWLAAKDAHSPWYPDPAWSVHRPDQIVIPPYVEFNANHTPERIRAQMALYYDEIHRADFHIGQVVETLRHQKRLDNTVIVLMSDNGSPFWKAKKFLTDPGLKTPLIVSWPARLHQHLDIHELASSVDIAPTLLQLAGLPAPEGMEGNSFAHWLGGGTPSRQPLHEFVYGERGDPLLGSENGRSIRDLDFLYIVDDLPTYTECHDDSRRTKFRREFLFDVRADPHNLHNLAPADNLFQRMLDRLRGETDYGDQLLRYRELMEQRRRARHDMPAPTIKGSCPVLWWQETPGPASNSAAAGE